MRYEIQPIGEGWRVVFCPGEPFLMVNPITRPMPLLLAEQVRDLMNDAIEDVAEREREKYVEERVAWEVERANRTSTVKEALVKNMVEEIAL